MAVTLQEYESRILELDAARDLDGILDFVTENHEVARQATEEVDQRLMPAMNAVYSIGDPHKIRHLQDLLNGRVPAGSAP